jgi:DNA repair photolyase
MVEERVEKKTLLYKSKVEYANFCANHVLGCAHGCKYPCYAMMMAKRFGKIKNYEDWLKPRLVSNALELLDREIPKYKDQINFVHLCFTTDPFMYGHKEVGDLTLKIIEKLNKNNIKTTVLTKGTYPKELAKKEKYGYNNIYGITLVSLDEDFKKRFEPFSAPFKERIKSLKYLHNAGLETWVSIEPYPTPNLVDQDLLEILEEASFADKIIFGKLNYNVKTNDFNGGAAFYENCAQIVSQFCKERRIEFHIKYGTKIKDDKTTEHILGKERSILAQSIPA